MKRIVFLLLVAFFLMGCGTAAERSQFYDNDSHYKNWDHLVFSWTGYRNASEKDADKSEKQAWWGEEVPVKNP